MSKHSTETDAEFDARYEAFFNRPDIDGWEIRKVGGQFSKNFILRLYTKTKF
jgi:cytochrome c oxidase subunit 5a